MKTIWKVILFAIVPLVIFLVIAKSMGWLGDTEESYTVELAKAELREIVQTVTASGKIQPEMEVKISPEVSGEIIELPVKEGQEVERGQLLLRINPDLYQSAVKRAEAAVSSAKSVLKQSEAQFVEAERNFNRNKQLHKEKVISESEFDGFQRAFDVAKMQVEANRFQLESARATLREAQDNLKRTTIYSPVAGTVSALYVEPGERVVGTAQMAGTEVMRIANLSDMEVLVDVNENDIVRVGIGDSAVIEVDAYMDKKFKGVVTQMANSAKQTAGGTDQITNFEVRVRMIKSSYANLFDSTRAKSPFRPGMTASVDIMTKRETGTVSVPIQAVTTRSDTSSQAKSYKMKAGSNDDDVFEVVFVRNGDKAQLRVVKTGIQDQDFIQILEGLEEGDEVITGPYSVVSKMLKNGVKVNAKEEKKPRDKKKEED